MNGAVRVRREPTVFPTYEPAAPDRNPMFLEKRVYQGSSGRVYPLPFIDRIAEAPTDRAWDAVYLENDFVSLMLLPEIGGRIQAGTDLTNGYDFFYRQGVIKPALVGLAGPWISGGVEFNWPQHHRPSTFMPTDVEIEHGEDGSITVWMSEHEPMNRMKGMHGLCLYPDRNVIELKVRLYNRTQYAQTFLWWTNIATRVHEAYKSFFPPDARMVADHAKRALSKYPLCEDHYYGVDYGARGQEGVPAEDCPSHFVPPSCGGVGPAYAPNDLSWYANIPVPTSYMCMGTKDDFFGGYDYFAGAGLLHVADHHIAPGKKQWTWGNHEFGYAWDRNLTDEDGPYIELMAGVYTDNQPDFSFLAPGETKTFSQFLYPYQAIGAVHFANLDTAMSVNEIEDGYQIGVAVTRNLPGATVTVTGIESWTEDLTPGKPLVRRIKAEGVITLTLTDAEGRELGRYENSTPDEAPTSPVATEPPLPEEIASTDELYLTGLHLDQYRHATRDAASYWREALRRDPGDMRCNNALGLWHLRRGEFKTAREHFSVAIERATRRNPNPYDGEAYYNLGVTLRFLGRDDEAVNAFGKAVWNAAWQAPGYHALAELACKRQDWARALDYLDRSLKRDTDNMRAKDLRVMVLHRLGRSDAELDAILKNEVLAVDPLDFWARIISGQQVSIANDIRIDIAIDMMRAGLNEEAKYVLDGGDPHATDGTAPMIAYYQAYLGVEGALERAQNAPLDYCFPARLEDILVLQSAIDADPQDARANYYLGNLLYDRRRHREAIERWSIAAEFEPSNAIVHRNLGIGYFNVLNRPEEAKAAYEAAITAAPDDARLVYERDQLWKRIGLSPEVRLAELRKRPALIERRDDLTIEFCLLLNAVGEPEEAAQVLASRKFQPWEGGEGQALGAYSRTHLELGRRALAANDAERAKAEFLSVLTPPENLSEARHLLANASDVWLALGDALAANGELDEAKRWWTRAAEFRGDFQEMSILSFSELTYFQAEALERLGRQTEARHMREELEAYARNLEQSTAKIDYFATSLPTMLLFEDDLQLRQENTARFLQAQAAAGLGREDEAKALLDDVLRIDPNHALASELRSKLQLYARSMEMAK